MLLYLSQIRLIVHTLLIKETVFNQRKCMVCVREHSVSLETDWKVLAG